jgi:hypothetical protein
MDERIRLRKRDVVAKLQLAGLTRRSGRIWFNRTVVFLSRYNLEGKLTPNRPASRNKQHDTGISYRLYPIIKGHGHDDDEILKYLQYAKDHYDVIVVVTSDADYFETLEALGKEGKLVVLLCIRGHTNLPKLKALRHVRYAWINDLIRGPVPRSLLAQR